MNKDVSEYPNIIKHNPVDGDDEALCPNCGQGKVCCGWGYRDKKCPVCGQKIKWTRW